MVISGLEENILKFHGGLQRYLLTCQTNSALLGRFFCTGQQQLWRPSSNLKIFFSRPLFTITLKPKMVSNLRKIFLCIVWLHKPTVQCCNKRIWNSAIWGIWAAKAVLKICTYFSVFLHCSVCTKELIFWVVIKNLESKVHPNTSSLAFMEGQNFIPIYCKILGNTH